MQQRARYNHLGRLPPLGLYAAASLMLQATPANAFCRSYTCESDNTCTWVDGCLVGGVSTQWRRACITYSVHEDGSLKRGITAAAAEHVLDQAYATWTNAWCGSSTPSIQAFRLEQVTCREVQVNRCDRNASAWIFHDEDWPYGDNDPTIALTWTHFDPDTGEILDADVEVNTAQHDITIGGDGIEFIDVATHETGHVFGLGHSQNHDATMFASYHFTSEITELDPDDVAGICTIYPPDRNAGKCVPEPLNGFTSECGAEACDPAGCCATAPGRSHNRHWVTLLGLGLGLALWQRRQSSRR